MSSFTFPPCSCVGHIHLSNSEQPFSLPAAGICCRASAGCLPAGLLRRYRLGVRLFQLDPATWYSLLASFKATKFLNVIPGIHPACFVDFRKGIHVGEIAEVFSFSSVLLLLIAVYLHSTQPPPPRFAIPERQ